ncbi:hypothetical protein IB276_36115 [Ensifer sp. ENS04]|uniref:hypothetical protein n=1 Tax=Ensifer sp. ENS04 TaxID=2769281 RepID=UPI0017834271|nr:hypothetical protein [Ensifer sp. ENS04]MBD9544857.1 hypothetical protein [Ensifer sp. ENS04]
MRRMVVDTNFLEHPELRDYLAASKQNFVILTDYAAMEGYKPASMDSMYRRMSVLRHFPTQVIVLRSTRESGALIGTAAQIAERLVDVEQTAAFPTFCRSLELAHTGNEAMQRQLLEHAEVARQHLQRMRNSSSELAAGISDIATAFTTGELKIIRRRAEPYPAAIREKIGDRIMELAIRLMGSHPEVSTPPHTFGEARDRYLFRAAICAMELAIRWIAVGGAEGAKHEVLRNDQVDIQFAAMATYFDGLFSNDVKLVAIYEATLTWLRDFAD